jgi:hypothetical protein
VPGGGGRFGRLPLVNSPYWPKLRREPCRESYKIGDLLVYKNGVVEGPEATTPQQQQDAIAHAWDICEREKK